ncbi:MAG: LPXTG cell wall anchor domain-containing protein [Lachnospiraceae bacterium]|nr:LPXTG cell wall anchor domain-containing protein [Lachnospiraceae bacterium]
MYKRHVLYDASSGITEKPSTEKPSTEKPSTEKPVTEKPSTERPVIQKPTTEKPITQKPTTEDDGIEPGIDRPIEPDTSTRAGGTARSSVGTLKSSGSAKTGDASPVTAMAGVIMISFAGFFVLRKKIKQL